MILIWAGTEKNMDKIKIKKQQINNIVDFNARYLCLSLNY